MDSLYLRGLVRDLSRALQVDTIARQRLGWLWRIDCCWMSVFGVEWILHWRTPLMALWHWLTFFLLRILVVLHCRY